MKTCNLSGFISVLVFVTTVSRSANAETTLSKAVEIKPNLPGHSLYQIQTMWTTADNQKIKLADLAGQPTIVSMVYLSCQYICPTVISAVRSLEDSLPEPSKKNVRVVIVSFDPAKDTPSVMKAYMKKRHVDDPRWQFVTGQSEADVRELAAALNFKFQKIKGGDFTHSFLILVLDKDGVPTARIDAANQDQQPLVDSLIQLTK